MKTAKKLLALLLALTMLLTLSLPAGAAEKQSIPLKKAIEQVLSAKTASFGNAYVYPFASFYHASVVKGRSTFLRFRKNPELSPPDNYIFCLTILRGSLEDLENADASDVIETRTISLRDFSAYGNGSALACALTWAADARYRVGDYTALCTTLDSKGNYIADQLVYATTLHVVSSDIAAEGVEAYWASGGDFYLLDGQRTYPWDTELSVIPMLYPLNTTASRKNITVTSSNDRFVSASFEDDYIILRGKTYGAPATITISCGSAATSFDVMFGSMPPVSAKQGKTTLCPGQTDQIDFSPKGYYHHWACSDTGVITVSDDGLVTAVGPGTAMLTLTMGYQTDVLYYRVNAHALPADAPRIGTAPTATKPVFQQGKCALCGREDAVNILAPAIFSDTSPNAWYSDHVDFAYENQIFTGVTPDQFKPNQPLTRGQMATVLYRIAGSPEFSSECPFTDVKPGRYYYNAILWAAENGIVTGYTDQTFRPDNQITREQIATILYRYVHYTGTEIAGDPALLEAFPDADKVGSYAKPALAWAVAEGLITGVATEGTTCLKPKNSATRAQVATILSRYLNAEPTEE